MTDEPDHDAAITMASFIFVGLKVAVTAEVVMNLARAYLEAVEHNTKLQMAIDEYLPTYLRPQPPKETKARIEILEQQLKEHDRLLTPTKRY